MSSLSYNNPDFIFKFALTGDSAVGKSSLIQRFADNWCDQSFLPTIGVDFKQKSLAIKNRSCKISIWDTAGQERFRNIIRTYYKGCHAVVLVFDLTDRQSFINVENWLEEVKTHGSSPYEKQFLLIIGNKCDMEYERKVTFEEGYQLSQQLGCRYVETSALRGEGVDKAFMELGAELIDYVEAFKTTQNQEYRKKVTLGKGVQINRSTNQNRQFGNCC